MTWRKCKGCGRVLQLDQYDDDSERCRGCVARGERPDRRRRNSTSQADAVARWREKTGNAYGKAYAKARAQAISELIEQHPGDFKVLMDKARIDHDLGPAR